MAHELITNGTFTGGLGGWSKSPSPAHYMFTPDSNKALAESEEIDVKRFQMRQSIEVLDTVLTASVDVWRQWAVAGTGSGGYTEFWVYLRKPDSTTIILYHAKYSSAGASGSGYALQDEDVVAYMDQAGVYIFEVACAVNPDDQGTSSKGWYDNISLEVTLGRTIELLDQNVFTEHFELTKGAPMEFLEQNVLTEHFSITRLGGLSTAEERMVVGYSDKKVYDFRPGSTEGFYDSDVLDFSTPGEEKTLTEGVLYSDSPTPHTVSVYVSTDAGVTWTSVGAVTLQKGKVGFVHPWQTAEAFKIRLRGYGFQMVSYLFWAAPRGRKASDD